MLEGAFRSWIYHFLGQYVESETVNVSSKLWKSSERLKLENLRLKDSVLPSWLPFRLKAGFIGQFEADLPIAAIFGSAAAKIKFVDVLLVLAPVDHDDDQEQEEIAALIAHKLQRLEQDLLDRWSGPQVPDAGKPHESEGYFGTDGWIGRTMTKLIDNLQVDIRNLHIRVESVWFPAKPLRTQGPPSSKGTTPDGGVKYALGVSLGALSAVTTPSNWRIDGFDDEQEQPQPGEKSNLVFKLINALDLSAYVDPNALHFIHSRVHPLVLKSTLTRLREMGSRSAPANWWNVEESGHIHRFFVAPITVSLKLTMNTATHHAQTEDPRYDAAFHLSRIHGALDEEQLSVLNVVIDAFTRHDKWRSLVAEQLRIAECAVANDPTVITKMAEEYLLLWKQIFAMKKDGIENVKKIQQWERVIAIEKQLPLELSIAIRNRLGLESVAPAVLPRLSSDCSVSICTEISVSLPAGPTGITLDSSQDGLIVTSVKPKSSAACAECVKPGLLLVCVDGKPVRSMIRFKTASQAMSTINSTTDSKILTFRHPTPKPPEISTHRTVSKINFRSDDLKFRLVQASHRRVLCESVLMEPSVIIEGFGPDLFSYHTYKILVRDFFIQNTSWSQEEGNHCIASSISRGSPSGALGSDESAEMPSAIMLEFNYLHADHPHARRDDVSTYGSKLGCVVGSSVLVFDHDKMSTLLFEVYKLFDDVSRNYDIVADAGTSLSALAGDIRHDTAEAGAAAFSSEASTCPANTTLSEEPLLSTVGVSNYTYDIKMEQLVLLVSAERKTAIVVPPRKEPSYRMMLKQLVNRDSTPPPVAPEWVKATKAIIVMQRFLRGAIVRRRKLVRLALMRSKWPNYQEDIMGWLYVRDDSLAFRRWSRAWCHLDEDGILSFHANGSGAELLDEFSVAGCTIIFMQKAKGPLGANASATVNALEIRTSSGFLRKVLSSEDVTELKRWKEFIELSARIAAKRPRYLSDVDEDILSYGGDDASSVVSEPFDYDNGRFNRGITHYDSTALEDMMLGGFSDVYQSANAQSQDNLSSWISFSVTDAVFVLDVHRVAEPEHSGYSVYLGVEYLSFVDHRLDSTQGGLLHVGDRFLALKNGVLVAGQIRSDHLHKGPFLGFNLTYRGARADPACFIRKNGLQMDLDISGWVKPLPLTGVVLEAIDRLSILWSGPPPDLRENDSTEYPPSEPPAAAPWFQVMEVGLHIRAPILEAYVEDAHTVAKLTIENSSCVYRADAGMENLKLHLGPTALFVLTNEVALRLAQIDRFRLHYDLRLHKVTDLNARCFLCADETAKRAVAHRSVSLSIGQIKLEADRRLELLFALIEAFTEVEEPLEPDDDGDEDDDELPVTSQESKYVDDGPASSDIYTEFDVSQIHRPFSQTERLNSMQFSLNDQDSLDLRPMYTGFGRQYYSSPTCRSRMSTATSAGLNLQGAGSNVPGRARHRSKLSVFYPLLTYQTFVAVVTDQSDRYSRSKSIFRVRLRVGKVHDRVSIACYSVVFEVIKRSLSVVSLDTYIPVMNFSLGEMKLQTVTRTEFSIDCLLDASVEMSARYYNSSLADWEPFVEPWRVYAKLTQDNGGSGSTMQLSAMQRLNVNFTDSLVRLLCSIAKNRRKRVFYVEKRTLAAVAADGEAKKADGRVCVLNNLGVPIRLANLNTSHAGTLHVDIRDGWSFPGYARFHNVRVEVTLLPWWHPREAESVENFRHKFALPYGGAQSGVTPILRIDVLSTEKGKREYVFDHVTNRYVEVDAEEDEMLEISQPESLTQSAGARMERGDSSSSQKAKWYSIGAAEINLAGSVMGSLTSQRSKSNRWHRLRDLRGNVTGEIFVGLDFIPHYSSVSRGKVSEPEQVRDGQFLVFDPLKTVTPRGIDSNRKASVDAVVLSDGLRGNYVPPLALEVQIGSERCNLLCPLRRAGKFLIQGEKVLAEVKVAQRDESRRVLLLSSPVQVKNETSMDMDVWTIETDQTFVNEIRRSSFDNGDRFMNLPTGNKMSVPISAMYGEKEHSVIVKVDGCKPTVVANLGSLAASSTILTLEPEDESGLGYCLFINITAHMRKVYREEHQDIVTRGNMTQDGDVQAYATKYQISLHSCLVLENTLPVRVQYQIVVQPQLDASMLIVRQGTLSPGDEVPIHDFQKNAFLLLRLPEMDSLWTRPIPLGDCIYRETMDREIKALLDASGTWDPVVEFLPSLAPADVMFKKDDIASKRVIARLDYTAADNGSPRIVLFCTLWIYNHSQVQTLLFRCADTPNPTVLSAPQLVLQRPVPRLMDCPDQEFEISTIIDHEVSRWSDKIHSAVVGIQAPISLRFGSTLGPRTRNEIGISIQRPMGQFHRTTQVVVTSRYVFVNRTNARFKVSQFARGNDNIVELPSISSKGVPSTTSFDFDTSSQSLKRQIYIRMDHNGAEWSGPFAAMDEIEFSLKLGGSVPHLWNESKGGYEREGLCPSGDDMNRVKIRITNVGASVVVTLSRDDPPMYVICNETSSDIYVNQVNFSNDMVVVRSKEFTPFAWAKPDRSWRIACRIGSGRPLASSVACVYDFANLDREKKMEGLRYRLFGNQLRSISAEIVVDRSSRVLIFRDQDVSCPPSYILEVKLIAARLRGDIVLDQDSTSEIVVETDNHSPMTAESKELRTAHVYRFDSDLEFACESRPKKLLVSFYDKQLSDKPRETDSSTIQMEDECFYDNAAEFDRNLYHGSPGNMAEATPFEIMRTPTGSPIAKRTPHAAMSHGSSSLLPRAQTFYHHDSDLSQLDGVPLRISDAEQVSQSYRSSEDSEDFDDFSDYRRQRDPTATVEIKLPKKAWSRPGVSARQSIALTYNTAEQAKLSLGRSEGHWWDMRDPETGDLVGEILVSLKFRTTERELSHPTDIFNMSVTIPSIGFSFLHNANSTMVEVAYMSMQRFGLLYSRADQSSEIVFSLGNLQMDNQMEKAVVLGPKVHRVKEGVSVRLRDRWQSFMNYRYRGIFEELDVSSMSVIQFRMLWNSSCNAGDFTHYEVIELVMQEIEVSTDEKFVVNLISVFQGIESLATHRSFEELVDTREDYVGGSSGNSGNGGANANAGGTTGGSGNSVSGGGANANEDISSDGGVYIEQLEIEAIRITFSMELHGGRYLKTLGPSGRRLAVYLPESNVKDFPLNLTKLSFRHLYEPKTNVIEKVTRRYQQQAVLLVLSGLHTVSVYANPIRIVYRFAHGVLELVRLPARGLASGSPIELLSGTYLGVRSLAMNVISASYEIVAGAAGIFGAIAGPLVPESRRKAFEDDLIGFQRAVIEEVNSFDAAEERTMTKVIVRKPREFDPSGVGLLTVYGPGSVPMEEQDRINHRAVVLLQHWWRRRRRANILLQEAMRLRPDVANVDARLGRSFQQCLLM